MQQPEYSVVYQQGDSGLFEGQVQSEFGVGNRLILSDDLLRTNTRTIQERYEIDVTDENAPLDAWQLGARSCPHFSVEMETGTGKTSFTCVPLPPLFWAQDYWLLDYWLFGLSPPPYGYVWVRDGSDALLIDRATGEIEEVIYGAFY